MLYGHVNDLRLHTTTRMDLRPVIKPGTKGHMLHLPFTWSSKTVKGIRAVRVQDHGYPWGEGRWPGGAWGGLLKSQYWPVFCFFFKILFTYSERGRDIGRGRIRIPVRNLMQDSIPGPRDHTLSWRQILNHWATQLPLACFLIWTLVVGRVFHLWKFMELFTCVHFSYIC